MAKAFVAQLKQLMTEAGFDPAVKDAIEIKHFFSGAACYANQNICVTLTPVGLGLKLPQNVRERLLARDGFLLLRYFPKAPTKKDYVLLPTELIRSHGEVHSLIQQSVQFVAGHD